MLHSYRISHVDMVRNDCGTEYFPCNNHEHISKLMNEKQKSKRMALCVCIIFRFLHVYNKYINNISCLKSRKKAANRKTYAKKMKTRENVRVEETRSNNTTHFASIVCTCAYCHHMLMPNAPASKCTNHKYIATSAGKTRDEEQKYMETFQFLSNHDAHI